MFTTTQAEIGEVVDFYVTVSGDEAAQYQWQQLYLPPLEDDAADKAIYPYGEGESTDYYFPLDDMTEAEVLAQNPDAVWPGIEMYYDQLANQPMLFSISEESSATAASDIHIENGTHNYVLEPDSDSDNNQAASAVWQPIEDETDSVYAHTVSAADAYTTYRCVITPSAANNVQEDSPASSAPSETAAVSVSPATSAVPEDANASAAIAMPAASTSTVSSSQPEASATPAEGIAANTLISDSMYVKLPESKSEADEGNALTRSFSSFAVAPSVALSSDKQWITGITSKLEYITKDTYDAQNGAAADNAYWTKISGGIRPDGRYYVKTTLTNGKMEVLSAWYGKTVYFREQGSSGEGIEIEIPAYTSIDYQSGQKTLYKNTIKVFNAWVPDTGGSYYATYLATALSNGNTPNGGHITIDKASIESFNRLSTSYLTNAEGDYIYDAVIIGAAAYDEPDLSGAAAWALKNYIGQGYGFLIGHDMLYGYGGINADPNYTPDPNSTTTPYYQLNTLTDGHYNMAWLMGQNDMYTDVSPYSAASMILCAGDYRDKSTLYGDGEGTSTLRIKTAGSGNPLSNVNARCPTNYPYSSFHDDGSPFSGGCILYGTPTHTNQQLTFGTVWLDYASDGLTSIGLGRLLAVNKDGLMGTNNFYLTTNGNLGMSQIGHTVGNKDIAKIDECHILANTLFYISQRQQCQVCQSEQGGNEQIELVRRISSADELAKLADQEKNWFTHPLDGCYMLSQDITLPANWQPIQGFNGHFDADGHAIEFNPDTPTENQMVFAAIGEGWALGTDPTQGITTIRAGTNKTTGVARVVGYLRQLFGTTNVNWAGAKVTVYGTDGQEYSCTANLDGKYVLSNLPCTGLMKARVWDATGNEITDYGPIRVNVPADFWQTDETTPLYLLEFTAIPVADTEVYEGADAHMLDGGVFFTSAVSADAIQWQVRKGDTGNWSSLQDVPELVGHYTVTAPVFHEAGDDSYTATSLLLKQCPESWSGWYFRAVFKRGSKTVDTYSAGSAGKLGKLTVKPIEISAILQKAADEPGSCNQIDDLTPDEYGQKVILKEDETVSPETATYTAIIYYHPDDLPDLSITPIWYYKSLLNTLPAEWNAATAAAIDSGITTEMQNTDIGVPQEGDAYYSAAYDGYHAIKSVLTISNIPTSMYNTATITKYFFQCGASATYSTSAGTRTLQGAASLSGGLVIAYSAYLHHNGVNVYERENTVNGITCNTLQQAAAAADGESSVWTYPQLEIHTPYEDQINTVVVRFQDPYSSKDTISYTDLPDGITVLGGSHFYIFQAETKNTVTKETWETLLRSMKFTVYDILDTSSGTASGGAHVQWWISEDAYESDPDDYKYASQLNSYYTVVHTSVTQSTARAAAEASIGPLGVKGHLIRFNSATGNTEATYLYKNVVASGSYWTDGNGGYWAGKSGADAGGPCIASTGLKGTYLLNDFSVGWGAIWMRVSNGRWQLDDVDASYKIGYIIEYNMPSDLALTETDHSAQDADIIGTKVTTTRSITVQANDSEKVYDGTELMGTATFGGNVSDPVQYLQAVYTCATPTAGYSDTTLAATATSGSCAINAGSYTVTWQLNNDGIQAGLELNGDTEGVLTITQRPLTIHSLYLEEPAIARNTKAYDGTTAATISNFIVDNRVPGDSVWLDKDHYAGTYATAQASETLKADGSVLDGRMFKLTENPIIRTEEVHLTNDPNENYYIKEENYSGAICRCTMSAFVGNFTSVYGEDIDLQPTVAEAYSATESGKGSSLGISVLMGNDTLTIDPEKSWFALPAVDSTSPAGKYPVQFEGLTEANYPVLSNYILWQQPGYLTITPRPLVIRTGSYSKVYGDPMPQFSPIFDGFVNGDDAASDLKGEPQWITDASATADVGRYEVRLEGYTAKDNANGYPNYVVYMLPGTLEITKRPIMITPTTDPDPDPMPELRRVTITKAADRTVLAVGDTVHYTITVTNIGTMELQNVPVRGSFDGSGQLLAADGQGYTYADGIFTITRLPVGKSITLACSYTAQADDAGHDLTNIAVASVPGKEPGDPGTEYPSDPVIVPVDPGKEPEPQPIADDRSIAIHKVADIAFAAVGDTINYAVTVTNTGSEDLLNITVQDIASNVSGDITPLDGNGYAWEGENVIIQALAAGETVTIRFTYTVQAADVGKNLRDYAMATVPGTNPPDPQAPDTGIDPLKPVTPDVEYPSNEVVVPVDPAGGVAADPKVKTYGDTDPALTYTTSEIPIQSGDIWGALERVPGEDVGVYPILQGTLQSKNYDITYIPAIFRIKPAALIVAADNKLMMAGQAIPKLTAKVAGFRFSDTLETATNNDLRITTPATQGSGAGFYPITPDGLTIPANSSFGEENYTVKYKPGLLTILGSIHPATGDSTPLLPLILCGGACLGMYGALAYRKKKNMK